MCYNLIWYFISNIFLFTSYKESMRNYILIITILTIIVVFIVIYLSDYIKGAYFLNCREDFSDAISIISGAASAARENFENATAATASTDFKKEYDSRIEARRTDFYEKSSPRLIVNKQEVSLNAQTEFYQNGVYDKYSSINDPIGDEFLPYSIKNYKDDPVAITTNNMNEYTIINVYKNILDRQPTDLELRKNLQDFYENEMDESILKLRIYNSAEYKIITNMQSNDTKPELITNISKGQLKDKLIGFYKDQHNTIIINTKLIDILIKCYAHLQFNDYLFRAMLMHDKYMVFENMLRNEVRLSDEKILEIFNKSFILYELRLIANELKRQDILKRKALETPIALYNNNQSLNTSNVNMGAAKNITDIVKNSDNVFNINIMVNDKNTKTSMPFAQNSQSRRQGNQGSQGSQGSRRQDSPSSSQVSQSGNQVSQSSQSGNQVSQVSQSGNQISQSSQIGSQVSQSDQSSSQVNIGNLGNFGNQGNIGGLGGLGNLSGLGSVGGLGGLGSVSGVGALGNQGNIAASIVDAVSGAGSTSASGGSANSTSATSATGGSSNSASSTGGSSNSASSTGGATGGAASATGGATGGSSNSASSTGGAAASATTDNSDYEQRYNDYKDQYNDNDYNNQYEDTQIDDQQYEDTQNDIIENSSRIYNPIDYKSHYRGDMRFRPNVCSYGTKQIVQPIFLNSSTLFQGTDLQEAAENTQVGSIMPKFEYYEYEDTR
jgi:hypothetical protein